MTVSLCLMARNEEENLAACLQSAADLVDETIVVDTGSTDSTRDLAGKLGAQVFEFPWVNDFAAARNECIRQATGDFIFWMDADERIDSLNREKLRALFRGLGSQEGEKGRQGEGEKERWGDTATGRQGDKQAQAGYFKHGECSRGRSLRQRGPCWSR